MTDHDFAYSYVPAGYADRVQWLSVIFPLFKPCHDTDEIRWYTQRLTGWWRARLAALQGLGWEALAKTHAVIAARNCLPTFTYATPRSRPCHLRAICPFCHGRFSRTIWEETERLLCGVNQPQYILVERFAQFEIAHGPDERLIELLQSLPGSRRQTLRRLNPAGAFSLTTIEPTDRAWLVRGRQLLLYKTPEDLPAEFFEETPNLTVRIHKQPTRPVLLKAVAHVCRYPTQMLHGDPELTAKLLELRRRTRARLTATYGVFREGDDD